MKCRLWMSCLLLSSAGVVGTADAQAPVTFKFTTIDVPGAARTAASGINNRGQIVGSFSNGPRGYSEAFSDWGFGAASAWHGFLLDNGSLTTFDFPDEFVHGTTGVGINDFGQIVGNFVRIPGELYGYTASQRAFILENGKFTLTEIGCCTFHALGINNRREIVGYIFTSTGPPPDTPWLYDAGRYHSIPGVDYGPHAPPSEALGISDLGQILIGMQGRFYILENGTLNTLPVPVWDASPLQRFPMGINARGQIVGSYAETSSGLPSHGFLLDNGKFTVIDVPGAQATRATGINDRGQIVGYYVDTGGVDHGFIAEIE